MSNCTTDACAPDTSRAQVAVTPRVDIVEHEGEFLLRAELPGADREDVSVTLEKGRLAITAASSTDDADRTYHVREFRRRAWRREFRLGDSVKADDITAEVDRGVLTVRLPKLASKQARNIEVR